MTGWIIDAYRHQQEIILWVKDQYGGDHRLSYPWRSVFYADLEAIPDLNRHRIPFKVVRKKTYLRTRFVLEIAVSAPERFESEVYRMERITRHQITLFNADIKPEQMFLYENDLCPFRLLQFKNRKITSAESSVRPDLRTLELKIQPLLDAGRGPEGEVLRIVFNGIELKGPENRILRQFADLFAALDPDVLSAKRAYALIPYLAQRLQAHQIPVNLHRWDTTPLEYRGGRSYWSYSQVRYQDYAVHLRGRLLIDTTTFVGSECDLDGIMELVDLSGTLFQPTVSRSFGAVFQTALVRLMCREGMIIPYKEKPVEPPLSMFTMLKADRGGLTIDPKPGFHDQVAELDFTSMFPWLIYNHNISVECLLSEDGPLEEIPHLPVRVSRAKKGLIPTALKPFIDRRMHYKENPSETHDRRARGLKWVLVSCYGYLRYREFKLGVPTSHMAICAYARQVLLECMHLAEARGFEVVHAIVDSVYLRKPGMTAVEVQALVKELELKTGIPISFEGIFKWMVFLSSRIDPHRALPSTYFGVFEDGRTKVRGLEIRQKGVPKLVKVIQEEALRQMKDCDTAGEIREKAPEVCAYARSVLRELPQLKPSLLTCVVCIRKTDYKYNIPQKIIVDKIIRRGGHLNPGQSVAFLYAKEGPVLPEEYQNNPDQSKYQKLIIRALTVLFEPFGFNRRQIREYIQNEYQPELDFSLPARFHEIVSRRQTPHILPYATLVPDPTR